MVKNYGLIIDEIPDPNAYVLGGVSSLPKIVVQEDGQWDNFLPVYEPQFGKDWDTYGCTIWGTLNIYEILYKKLFNKEINFSERFNYIISKVRPPGADPHKIAEDIRNNGTIEQDFLPMTETYEEFIQPDPMEVELLVKGQQFPHQLKHEWVWRLEALTREERMAKIIEALQYSPLGVSVSAWHKEGDVYVDKGQPNEHWCVLYGVTDNGYKIFDTYDHSKKILSFDHNIMFCKRYMLVPRTAPRNWLFDIIKRLFSIFK